ncbi:MAG TPA: type 4a pilus biogenesis protein PilO, partial [Actinomycetota bacterium]|nr:type 4a pilus biogenesis protein PilO [Actinomycetota bacterium]
MNRSQQALIAGLSSILVTLAFFFLVLKPKMTEVADARAEVETAQDEERSLRNDLRRLQDVRARAPESTSRLARISRLLPSSPELPGFIRSVQGQANLAGIELKSIA